DVVAQPGDGHVHLRTHGAEWRAVLVPGDLNQAVPLRQQQIPEPLGQSEPVVVPPAPVAVIEGPASGLNGSLYILARRVCRLGNNFAGPWRDDVVGSVPRCFADNTVYVKFAFRQRNHIPQSYLPKRYFTRTPYIRGSPTNLEENPNSTP